MFEKEVKKYLKDSTDYYDPREPFTSRKVLQMCMDCAELGYNKAKEEMIQNGLALQSDMDKTIEQNIALKKELNKANEWHFVKDGDLPKDNTQVLVLLENKRMKISIFMEKKFTVWNKVFNTYTKLYNVIAWKEIVLPEQKESE